MDAIQTAPSLAQLLRKAQESMRMLHYLQPHMPSGLVTLVQAGSWDNGVWCLLVRGNACAAKVRQLSPLWIERLKNKGWEVQSIRIRVVH